MAEFTDSLPTAVAQCVEEVKLALHSNEVRVLKAGQSSIAIPFTVMVPIPMRGTVENIDIKAEEPILVEISLSQYPSAMPNIYSDRKDFPRNRLSHLYCCKVDEAVPLCLVRNNRAEWFANKTIQDLLIVVSDWLFKAATNTLVDDGSEWDPLRITRDGYHAYPYNMARDIVVNDRGFKSGWNAAFLFGYAHQNTYGNKQRRTYRSLQEIPLIQIAETIASIKKVRAEAKDNSAKSVISILVWSDPDVVNSDYQTTTPETYGELKAFLETLKINIDETVKAYLQLGCDLVDGIPVIVAIRRPKKLIGYNDDYEFLNFRIDAESFTVQHRPYKVSVSMQTHIEPFTSELAGTLSGESRKLKAIYIGAGSLGSKMIFHDARSGKKDMLIIDPDEFLQHNLTRHALLSYDIGQNKAQAVATQVDNFFLSDVQKNIVGIDNYLHNAFEKNKSKYEILVDTTAGMNTLNYLTKADIPEAMIITRAELADEGRLGLLYAEGSNRNPRIDDLVNLAYYEAINDKDLQGWRRRDANRDPTNLSVGLGCSSTTVIAADDTISFHASLFSRALFMLTEQKMKKDDGSIYQTVFDTIDLPQVSSVHRVVQPFEIYSCNASSDWQIRMKHGLSERLLKLCKKKAPNETGGVLVGLASYKTKTIHIFDLIEEPRDSKGTCTGFTRGTKGLPKQVNHIKEKTGNTIGYIGEWHTHPMDLERLSTRDEKTIEELKNVNSKTPIPTLALIVTTRKVLPFVFQS